MSTQIQQLRGTTAENDNFTGGVGVITVDTEKHDIRVHDGWKRGGYSLLDRSQGISADGGTITGHLTVNNGIYTPDSVYTNNWLHIENKGDPYSNNIGVEMTYLQDRQYTCQVTLVRDSLNIWYPNYGDVAKFGMDGTIWFANTVNIGGKTFWSIDGNISGSRWENNNLYTHIDNRAWWYADDAGKKYNKWCVTDSRYTGWAEITPVRGQWVNMPSGYVVTATRAPDSPDWPSLGGRQPQLFIENRGWFPLGGW